MIQRTLVIVKPDAVRRRLIGELIRRLEERGLDIVAMKLATLDKEMATEHYWEHREKSFFDELLGFITSGPLVAMAVEGEEAIDVVRALMGATDPKDSEPGTIRGDLGTSVTENLVHGSDSPQTATRELRLFFPELP